MSKSGTIVTISSNKSLQWTNFDVDKKLGSCVHNFFACNPLGCSQALPEVEIEDTVYWNVINHVYCHIDQGEAYKCDISVTSNNIAMATGYSQKRLPFHFRNKQKNWLLYPNKIRILTYSEQPIFSCYLLRSRLSVVARGTPLLVFSKNM